MKQKFLENKFPYKKLKLEEINKYEYLINSCISWNLVKLITGIFFNREHIIKLFDLRILSSLILRDLRKSKTNRSFIIKSFPLFILPMFIYCMNCRNIVEINNSNLERIIYGSINYREKRDEISRRYLHSSMKDSSILLNYPSSLERKEKKYKNYLLGSKNNVWVYKQNILKKEYIKPGYDKIDFYDSQQWNTLIIKKILPSWRISNQTIDKVNILLKDKNVEDLKHFFEYYTDNIMDRYYHWKYSIDVISYNDRKNQDNLNLKKNLEFLDNKFFFCLISAFCEKMLFEVEGGLFRHRKIRSTLNLKNMENFSAFEVTNKEILKWGPHWWKKPIFHIFNNYNESDQIIAKSFLFLKKKKIIFFQNYTEFYVWLFYQDSSFHWRNDKKLLDTDKNTFKENYLQLIDRKNKLYSSQNKDILWNILYNFSNYVSDKIKKSDQFARFSDTSIINLFLINQNLVYHTEKNGGTIYIKKKKTWDDSTRFYSKEKKYLKSNPDSIFSFIDFNLIEKICFKPNKYFLNFFLDTKDTNKEGMTKLKIHSYDPSSLIESKQRYFKFSYSHKFIQKDFSFFWMKERFMKDIHYFMEILFSNKIKIINNYFRKFISHAFLDISLSIDESIMSFCVTDKYIRTFQSNKSQTNILLENYILSDTNRIKNLWKVRKKFKNAFFVSSISNLKYKRIQPNKSNSNKLKFISFLNWNLSHNGFYLCWSILHKYNKQYIFNRYVKLNKKLVKKIEQFHLLITKPNQNYDEILYSDLEDEVRNFDKSKINKLNSKFFLISLNSIPKKENLTNQVFPKKRKASSKEKIENYISPVIYNKKWKLWYNLNKESYQCFGNALNKYYSIYKYKFCLINKIKIFWVERIENAKSSNFTRKIVNQHSSNWKKNRKEWSDYNIKRNKYINWNSYIYQSFGRTRNLEKISIWFSDQYNTSKEWFNQIEFLNTRICITYSKNLEKYDYSKFSFISNTSLNSLVKSSYNKKNIPLKRKVLHNYNLSRNLVRLIDNKLIPQSFINKKLIKNIIISFLDNEINHDICIQFSKKIHFPWIYKNRNNGFNSVKKCNKRLMKKCFHNTNKIEFLDYLHGSHSRYDERLPFFIKKIHIRNYDFTYKKFLKFLPIYNHIHFMSIGKIKPFFFKLKTNIILSIQSQVFNRLFFNYLQKSWNYTLVFLTNYLYKLLNLFIKMNSSIYVETDRYSIQKVSTLTYSEPTTLKLKGTYYCKLFSEESTLERNKFNQYFQFSSKPNRSHIQNQSYKNDLSYDFLPKIRNNNNNNKLQWIKKSFLKSNLNEGFKYLVEEGSIGKISINLNLYERKKNILPYFSSSIMNFLEENKKTEVFKKSYFLKKWYFFQNYTLWFFTSQWWKYLNNVLLETFPEILLNTTDQSKYISYKTMQYIEETLKNVKKNLEFMLETSIFNKFYRNSEIRLLKQIHNQQGSIYIYIWSHFNFINLPNAPYLTIISLSFFGYLAFQNYFSTSIGLDYIDSWRHFKVIQYLRDPLRGSYLERWMYQNQTQFIRTESIFRLLLKNIIYYIKNGRFLLFTIRNLNTWLFHSKSLDISRRKKELLVQSVITEESISKYGLEFKFNHKLVNSDFGYEFSQKPGFSYLKYLAETYQKDLVNYSSYSFHLAEKWILLAFWKRMISSRKLWQTKNLNHNFSRIPVPFQLELFPSKGILLVGPMEIGRSYLIKNLAADSYVPLIQISISKLLYNKPDVITESWINILMESLRRLTLILELTKKMSPCIMWIQDIHELNVNRSTQNVESDPTSLLGVFLKYFHTEFLDESTKGIIIIGSTHIPKKIDPALISPNRLDKLINIRMINIFERQEKFSILLHSKRFYFKNKLIHLNEFAYRTMGYNARDLVALANEVSLINTIRNDSIIHINSLRLALHRQTLGFTYMNNKILFCQNQGILLHKVGRAIIQNLFIKNFPMNPLYIGNDLWKKNFYYLSEWYLEPSVTEPTIKELTILSYILGCLAGLAARDSWFILEHKRENFIPLNKFVEDDFDLACGILESLLVEFSCLEIFKSKSIPNKIEFFPKTEASYSFNMMQRGILSITNNQFMYKHDELRNRSVFKRTVQYKEKLYELANETTWAPRIWRLSFIRSNLFDWIKRPNEFESLYSFWFFKKKEQTFSKNSQENLNYSQIVQYKTKEQLLYERILSRIRRRNVQELESQLASILSEDQIEILGFSKLSTQYRIEYQLFNKPMLFMGGRFIWDPTGFSFKTRHFVFSRRELFIDEEMLRRLYVTYGARRERERSRSSQKIKQFFLRCGYGRNFMNNLSIGWWNQLSFAEKYNIEIFKRIEEISVQLKHPQVFTPVYLYQSWLIENSREKLSRFDLLNHRRRWIKLNNKSFHDFSIHSTLLESYKYLLNFFISNKILLNGMTKILLKKGWLFQNEIEHFIHIIKKEKNNR
uniref:Protein Ycf2 n=1 Tax=Leiosporoceros dussii TaxID=263836 RepID=A0A385KDY7_9EMBR|nr:cell division protein [Leiosporoceros dussii]AXZ70883.1 cell division protein [Leiosporoceros dussii]